MPKAKFEGIYRSIKQKIEAQDYPYQSLLPAESELKSGRAWIEMLGMLGSPW